jgi:hypothetical protein
LKKRFTPAWTLKKTSEFDGQTVAVQQVVDLGLYD